MSSVVVAVDFSNTSIHAMEYGIALANKMKAGIHLVWVDKINPQESVYPDTSNENRSEAKKRFEELIGQYKPSLGKGITIDYKLRKGKIHREIDVVAQSVSADLIVAGAHGISGFEEYWIGSNAYKMVSFTSIPVITVRHDFPVSDNMKRILVPMDGSAETLQKIPFVVRLAKLFKSEVHLYTTHSSTLKSIQRIACKWGDMAKIYLDHHGIKVVSESIVSNDLTRAVLTYADKIDARLIAIMTEQETPVNILLGAQAQQLINQSPVPVLSIHSTDKFILE